MVSIYSSVSDWKVLGSSQDVINLKEEIMASQVVQEEMSGLSHHGL